MGINICAHTFGYPPPYYADQYTRRRPKLQKQRCSQGFPGLTGFRSFPGLMGPVMASPLPSLPCRPARPVIPLPRNPGYTPNPYNHYHAMPKNDSTKGDLQHSSTRANIPHILVCDNVEFSRQPEAPTVL